METAVETAMEPADRVFISYAHKDPGHYVEEVQRQLRIALKDRASVEVWIDEDTEVTQDWDREIQAALDRCACAILLITPNFLDSPYICERELPVLLSRAQAGTLGLIPVFVSRVPARALRFSFPRGGKTETFDLDSRQGVNGPDQPLDGLTDAQRGTLIARLADQVGGWLAQRQPAAGAPDRPTRRPSATPPVAPSDRRPELVLEFQKARGRLRRRYYLTDGARPTEIELPETHGEHALDLWEPCVPIDGDALTSLLIGDDPKRWTQLLAAAAGEPIPAPNRGLLVPPRHPVRVRLLGGGDLLTKLPWHQLAYQGTPLREFGWTVECSPQPVPDQRPRFPNHSLAMPGPVLAVFSHDRYRAGHLDDLRGLFRTLWPKRSTLFEATHLDQLRFELQERPPRLLYYFGAGRWDRATGTYLLDLPDRDGHPVGLSIAELAQAFGVRAPEVCFLNLVDDQGCHAMAAAGALVDDRPGRARAAVIHCTPSQDSGQAAEVGFRWLEHLLVHRSDPVIAFHHAGARHGGCWSAYQDWQTSTNAALDDDLVEYLLDRRDQSEHLLGVCRDLVTGETPLRVQFRLAIGTRGNRVHDFARQAEVYLVGSDFAGVFVYPRGPVHLSAEAATPAAVELAFRRAFRLAPRADLFAALRHSGPDFGGEVQVPLLCWRVESDDEPSTEALQSLAGAVLEWTWERLAIGCPAGLRIIALLVLESAEVAQVQQSLRTRARALEDQRGPRPSFRFRPMPPPGGGRRGPSARLFRLVGLLVLGAPETGLPGADVERARPDALRRGRRPDQTGQEDRLGPDGG